MPAPFAMPCDGGSIPPISTTRGPVGFPGAVVPGRRLISGRRVACPPARRPRRELRSARRLEARPGPAGHAAASNWAVLGTCAPPPPTGTAAAPSGALHTSGAGLLIVARRIGSKPGQAPQATRRPPIGRSLGRACLLWPRRRPPAPRLEARPGVAIAHCRPLSALRGLT